MFLLVDNSSDSSESSSGGEEENTDQIETEQFGGQGKLLHIYFLLCVCMYSQVCAGIGKPAS